MSDKLCMTAQPYDPSKPLPEGEWFVEPKLDGVRCLVQAGRVFSRQGKPLPGAHWLADQFPESANLGHLLFDGELMSTDGAKFDVTSGRVRRRDGADSDLLEYVVWDVLSPDCPLMSWAERRVLLEALALHRLGPRVRVLDSIPLVMDPLEACSLYVQMGYEGAMLKRADAPYQFTRSKDLLKVKPMHDTVGKIVAVGPGKGKRVGLAGQITIYESTEEHGIVTTDVGNGWSHDELAEIWVLRDKYLGRHVEVWYQERTPDGRLRFPRFRRWRTDLDP